MMTQGHYQVTLWEDEDPPLPTLGPQSQDISASPACPPKFFDVHHRVAGVSCQQMVFASLQHLCVSCDFNLERKCSKTY